MPPSNSSSYVSPKSVTPPNAVSNWSSSSCVISNKLFVNLNLSSIASSKILVIKGTCTNMFSTLSVPPFQDTLNILFHTLFTFPNSFPYQEGFVGIIQISGSIEKCPGNVVYVFIISPSGL